MSIYLIFKTIFVVKILLIVFIIFLFPIIFPFEKVVFPGILEFFVSLFLGIFL